MPSELRNVRRPHSIRLKLAKLENVDGCGTALLYASQLGFCNPPELALPASGSFRFREYAKHMQERAVLGFWAHRDRIDNERPEPRRMVGNAGSLSSFGSWADCTACLGARAQLLQNATDDRGARGRTTEQAITFQTCWFDGATLENRITY
jgi:hypothetical protein